MDTGYYEFDDCMDLQKRGLAWCLEDTQRARSHNSFLSARVFGLDILLI